jgi:hypothetical protein
MCRCSKKSVANVQENGGNSVRLKVATLITSQAVAETGELRQPANRINESTLRSTIYQRMKRPVKGDSARRFTLTMPRSSTCSSPQIPRAW